MLITVGKTINPDTKVIDCIARIDRASDVQLVNQSFVEATVIVSDKTAKALPVSALQKVDKAYFIYVLELKEGEKYLLKKTPVEVGASDNNFTEILSGLPADKQIVVRGIETL
jgi:multidrug efflux pump subunit AcrA (membrane-fusion protein)